MYTKEDYIAVFDSGVGGVSVLRHLYKQMPCEKFVYFGDTANAPYGSRTTDKVRELTLAAVEKLRAEYPLKALVVACNTATAAAIETLRAAYPDFIVIGIEPALKLAADHFPGGRIGVMATQVTLREEKFDTLMHRFDRECTVTKIPAPGLVELIEGGKGDSLECEMFLRDLLGPHVGQLDALVLGCTHYPFVQRTIRKVLGPDVTLLHGGEGTARETKRRLAAADLLRTGEGKILIRESKGDPKKLHLARQLLGQTKE